MQADAAKEEAQEEAKEEAQEEEDEDEELAAKSPFEQCASASFGFKASTPSNAATASGIRPMRISAEPMPSRRRDCYTLPPSLLERSLKGVGVQQNDSLADG